MGLSWSSSAKIYLFKFSNKNTGKGCEICSKLKIKTQERHQWKDSDYSCKYLLLAASDQVLTEDSNVNSAVLEIKLYMKF